MKDMHPDREDTHTQAYILTRKHTHTHTHTHILKEESYISSFYMK